ncbi:glycosyltransferase family 2 protein [Hyphococcus formosus]|uniref:glycosyltransferase family 2 protein n=1 Tax=Hyphococcus formosus TaxID=3143534 RepID=UPI00398AACCC
MNQSENRHPVISVIAPMLNEAGGAATLVDEIAAALAEFEHEIIIIDDASTDETRAELRAARKIHRQLRILCHEQNAGQSRAIRTGVLAARADVVAMLDGDGQNDPVHIPALYRVLMDADPDVAMAAGERQKRQDSRAKKWASRAANTIRQKLLDDGAADTGCGLKVFRREAFMRLPYFDHMHRYLPALIRREGFKVVFMPVSHRARAHGVSKYTNIGRALVAVRDLFGVMWLRARAKSPGKITEQP